MSCSGHPGLTGWIPRSLPAALGRDAPMKLAMLVGTGLWFAASPYWLKGGSD
jgi:hypothetical protein